MLGMILSGLDITDLTFELIIKALAVFIVVWFVVKNFLDVRKTAKEQIVREQKWDNAAKIVEEKEKVWDDGLADIRGERKAITDRYDDRLDELEEKVDSGYNQLLDNVKDNATDTEAKFQEVKAELLILTECMRAVLDGLYQQGCNGKVTEARQKLDEHLVTLIGK